MARDLARYFKPNTYLYRFFDEKDISRRGFNVKDSQGLSHDIPLEVVLEAMAQTRGMELRKIEETLRKIDFHNGDVRHFLEHLAKGLAEQYSGAMRFASSRSFAKSVVRWLGEDPAAVAGYIHALLSQWEFGFTNVTEDVGQILQPLHKGRLPHPPKQMVERGYSMIMDGPPARQYRQMAEMVSSILEELGEGSLARKVHSRILREAGDTTASYTVPREGYRVKGVGLPVRGRIVEKVGPFWDGGDFVVVERDVSGLRGEQDPYMYAVVDRRGTMTHFFGTIPSKGHGRKFYERHSLGPSRLAYRVARRWLGAGFNRDEFDLEKADFGVQVRRSWGSDAVYLYFPLENIGRRGKKVTKIGVEFPADAGGTAWAHTYLDRVKGVSNARAALKLLKDTMEEAGDRATMWDREVKGIDSSLPTPTLSKIEDIRGRNISVDMNTKPIRVYDEALGKELQKSFQQYWFRIPHRFKQKVHALRDEIASARSYKEVEKILDANKVRYDFDIHMDPMYQ